MKKTIFIIALVVVVLFTMVITFGCGKEKETNIIRIGAILPLTGPYANFGVEEQRGMDLAVEEINSKGLNNQIQIIYEDSKGDPKLGISAYNKLTNINKINFLVTSMTGVSMAIKPLSIKNNYFQNCFAMTEEIAINGDNIFRFYPSLKGEGHAIVNYINNLKSKKIAIINYNSEAFENLKTNTIIPGISKDSSNNIYSYSFIADDIPNIRNILSKVNNDNPDIIVIAAYDAFITPLLKTIKENNYFSNSIIIGTVDLSIAANNNPSDEMSIFENTISIVPKSIIYSTFINQSPKEYVNFLQKYKDKYNKGITFDATFGYDFVHAFSNAIENNDNITSESISKYIKNRKFNGVNGIINIDNNGNASTDWNIIQYINGEMNLIE